MLKSFPIFKRNSAHLVQKKTLKKKQGCLVLQFECFERAKPFLICVKLWACKLFNLWKIFQITSWESKLLCFPYDFSNIQKCSFKECPLTCVAPLSAILPTWNGCVELNNIGWNSLEITIIPCQNVLILSKQCFDVGNNRFFQCYIQLNCLKVVSSSQIEDSYLEILQ
jgi:hypothetical protein